MSDLADAHRAIAAAGLVDTLIEAAGVELEPEALERVRTTVLGTKLGLRDFDLVRAAVETYMAELGPASLDDLLQFLRLDQ